VFFILFLILAGQSAPESITSIHQAEYYRHQDEAVFSPVSRELQPALPLQPRVLGMLKNYYGYLPYWTDTVSYAYFQMELLTHIAYFSVDIDPATGDLGAIPNLSRFTKIRDYAHGRGVRIHMTYTVFNSSNVSSFLNNAAARANAVAAIRDFTTNYGIEGANIDFEFVTSSVRDSFDIFINDLAVALRNHPTGRKELYLATPAVPEWYPGYDFAYLAAHCDGQFIMAYDFHWSNSSVAGPVSPCLPSSFWGAYCVAKSIGSYKAYGVGGANIILGLPYYGYDWPTTDSSMGSSTTGTGTAVIYYNAYQNADTYGRLWDNNSMTPWYRYSTTGWHQCWYDDSVSLGIKFGMTVDSSLQGAGCWALGYDRSYDHIWNAIRRAFWVEPPTRHFTAEVNIDSLNVRDGPGMVYRILTKARIGSKFAAFDYVNNWYKIYFPAAAGPYYAWASGGDGITYQYLKGTTQNEIIRVTADLLNVREGPGTSYPIITQIARGQVFVADSADAGWERIFLPMIGGFSQGWVSATYANVIPNPEDANAYNGQVTELAYPPTVNEYDTFTVTLKITNTGWGPFDTLVLLDGNNPSPFYYPGQWPDQAHAQTWGFPGLPNQTFYISARFQAPHVTTPAAVSDTFRFERKLTDFGPQFIVTVTVNPLAVVEKGNDRSPGNVIVPTLFNGSLKLDRSAMGDVREISVYDISGRRVIRMAPNAARVLELGGDLPAGIYFINIVTDYRTLMYKVIKVR
jgi:spore germination protein YaaH